MERKCKNCKHYTAGVPGEFLENNHGTIWKEADGICHLYFPRGYIGRKPPHPTSEIGRCFQFEPKAEIEGQEEIK